MGPEICHIRFERRTKGKRHPEHLIPGHEGQGTIKPTGQLKQMKARGGGIFQKICKTIVTMRKVLILLVQIVSKATFSNPFYK